MENTINLYLFFVVIIFIITYFVYFRVFKTDTYDLEIVDGWISLDWNTVNKDKSLRKYIEFANEKVISQGNLWSDFFINNYFPKIHFSDKRKLFSTCKYLFDHEKEQEQRAIDARRLLTVSSIIYNFKIPHSLWLLDSVTLEIVFKYKHLTRLIDVNFDFSNVDRKEINLSRKQIHDFKRLTIHCANVYEHALKLKYNDLYPNVVYLSNNIKKMNLWLFKALQEDVNNIKRLLTVYFIISKVSIPADYFLMDDIVESYLYRYEGTTHLKLVN